MFARLHRSFALLSLAALLSACAAFAPGERYAAPADGTTYVIERRETGSYGNGTSEIAGRVVRREWNGSPTIGFEDAQSTLLLSPDGGYVAVTAPDGKTVMSWEPPLGHSPLVVGSTSTAHYKLSVAAQHREVSFDYTVSIEAYEDVVVPAGTFRALRMRTSDTLGNENVSWYAPELGMLVKGSFRRTEKNALGAGTRESQITRYTRPGH